MVSDISLATAILLSPDRFTSVQRTPWAGTNIGKTYKSRCVPAVSGRKIGESWEFSCDPTFVSTVQASREDLISFVRAHAAAVFGPQFLERQPHASIDILIKLLNAAQPLSLQVHPRDGDPALSPDECGKPESWLILDAEPGAGLYLGFNRPLDRNELRTLLLNGDAARSVLHFVPVQRGDYFEIEPGVPHAIGPGVTLLEPQRIHPKQSGKTYRLWDWGRRYDAAGVEDQVNGQPRELHLEESLRLVDPMVQVGEAFVAQTRRSPKVSHLQGRAVELRTFPSNPYYQTSWCTMQQGSSVTLAASQGYVALISLRGRYSVIGRSGQTVELVQGQPALIPNSAFPVRFVAAENSELVTVTPKVTELTWRE